MLTAISRYGARVLPITEEIVAGCKARGEFIQGPQIAEFEAAFAGRHGLAPAHAIAAAYGRIAFYYMLKALDLPPGSEIIFPSLTFWVVPELARVAGLFSGRAFNIESLTVGPSEVAGLSRMTFTVDGAAHDIATGDSRSDRLSYKFQRLRERCA